MKRIIMILVMLVISLSAFVIVGCSGTDGADGKSAYQIWLDNGNTGSQSDFLNWLKGEKGEDGKDGVDGQTPTITIGTNGNWYINGVDTEVKAQGNKGEDGVAPTISIIDGYWYINGEKTETKAVGEPGADGTNGVTPKLQINSTNNMWEVSYDNGKTWESLGVLAIQPEDKISSITVGGTNVSSFKIYAVNSEYATIVKSYFTKLLGVELLISATAPASNETGYIIIDQTEMIENRYGIRIENGNVIIYGSYNSIETAVEYFCGDYFDSFFKKDINLKASDSVDKYTEKKVLYTKEQLKTIFNKVYNETDAFMVGAMASGGYSRELPSKTLSNFYNATGQYPAILGFEASTVGLQFANKELDSILRCVDETKKFLTEEQYSQVVCELVNYCANGGIVTVSSHFVNPTEAFFNEGLTQPYKGNMGNKTSQTEYEQAFLDVITEGTEYNTIFKQELDLNARLFKALRDNGIKVLYRPFQEMNASTFWWCVAQDRKPLDKEQSFCWVNRDCFKNLWKYVYNYYTNTLGLDNLIWVFSPINTETDPVAEDGTPNIMACYPGDEYVDIVGVDWYTKGNRVSEIETGKCYYNLANSSEKVAGMCEFGPSIQDYTAQQQLADFIALIDKGYKFSYVLNWNGDWAISSMGGGREYMESEYTLSQEEVGQMFKLLG